jgi:hypothetical protein
LQPGIELDLAGRAIVPDHQTAIIVEQHFLGDPAEMAECAFQPRKPALLPLVAERPDVLPARIAERCDEQIRPHLAAAISTRRSPKSICSCLPGGVSNRTVARASAASSCR